MSLDRLTELYKKVYPIKLKKITKLLKGDTALAEDVVQEAFTRAIKYIHLFNEERGSIETWFNAILFNTMRDIQKQERHVAELNKEIHFYDLLDPAKPLITPEYLVDIYKYIQNISNRRHRSVLELFFIYGYSSKEISKIESNMTQSNVTTIVMRFREQLKKQGLMG